MLDTYGTMVSEKEETTMTTKEEMLSLRRSTGLSQAAFGRRFGIPKRTIQNWELGVNECPTYVAELLAFAAKTDYHTPRLDGKRYRVKREYLDNWTDEYLDELIVTDAEIRELANGWSVNVDDLMNQVEEL